MDTLTELARFLTARPGREAELIAASNRSLERAREADRRLVTAHAALREISELGDRPGCFPENVISDAEQLAQDALAETNQDNGAIRLAGDILVNACHGASIAAGWWTDPTTGQTLLGSPFIVPAKLMLMVSELSEAMEGHRKGLPDDKLPHRKMIEVELADAVIRIADLAGALGLDLGGAIAEKMAFNLTRPDHQPGARMADGGKAY